MKNIQEFLQSNSYDVRIRGNNPRWIDQKCTPDVLWSIADFVVNYIEINGENATFTTKQIWNSDYAQQFIREEFTKPDTQGESSTNEYDKFFGQPLNLLCFANILEDVSPSTTRHIFKVKNKEGLEYISSNDLNAYKFLCTYIERVLEDSGLLSDFNLFFEQQNKTQFQILKNQFKNFCFQYTQIRNTKECGRIFTKVLNPLACKYRKKGTKGGRLSQNIIPKQDLMYNRDNFRDLYENKPKNITRKDWVAQQGYSINEGYLDHQMRAATRTLRAFNDVNFNCESELTRYIDNQDDSAQATQIHHIFPQSDFPSIKAYLENLIALTPNQHSLFVHPNNHTAEISLPAQKDCLIAKTYSIKDNLSSQDQEHIYDFVRFLEVLSVGWSEDNVMEIVENDYYDVLQAINSHYINTI